MARGMSSMSRKGIGFKQFARHIRSVPGVPQDGSDAIAAMLFVCTSASGIFQDRFDPRSRNRLASELRTFVREHAYLRDATGLYENEKPEIKATLREMEELIEDNPMVVMNFSASWCPPCKEIAPQFEQLPFKKGFENVRFVKCDVDSC